MLDRLRGSGGNTGTDAPEASTDASPGVIADNKRQVEQLRPYIRPHEVLRAVFERYCAPSLT